MSLDLETLKAEMQVHLETQEFAVFHGFSRLLDSLMLVYWDTESHPDFREFLTVAKKAGLKLIVFYHRAFSLDQIDEGLDRLQDTSLSREEQRSFENRLRELQAYEGFTCSLELSFDYESRVYLYEIRTDWYQNLTDILAEIEAASDENQEDDDDDGPMPGYFSKN